MGFQTLILAQYTLRPLVMRIARISKTLQGQVGYLPKQRIFTNVSLSITPTIQTM